MGLFTVLLDLLYPPRCVFCRKLLETSKAPVVCPACRASLRWAGSLERRDSGAAYNCCIAPLFYEGSVRESLLRYKFSGCACYAETYGILLADCIRKLLEGRWDCITWVPLSRSRLRERGYDQARMLAEASAKVLGKQAIPLLEKTRNVKRQSSTSSARERRQNISGVYRATDPETTAGCRILLVDDIITTGSTLGDCTRALLEQGAAEVLCAVLAMDRRRR